MRITDPERTILDLFATPQVFGSLQIGSVGLPSPQPRLFLAGNRVDGGLRFAPEQTIKETVREIGARIEEEEKAP